MVVLGALGVAAAISQSAPKQSDVSQFLTQEASVQVGWGSPGGIAFDGVNFLIAARSTNGGVLATRFDTNGIPLGSPISLAETGGLPRVAFDGSNYLIVWPNFTSAISDIYGQLIHPDGTPAGSPFLIEPAAGAAAMGGLVFDGTNYLAVWESERDAGVFSAEGRFVSPAGSLVGSRLDISDGDVNAHFPDVVWNGAKYLAIWTSETNTNQWDVRGRLLNRDGVFMDSIAISDSPAQQAWPPTVASDGTNWLTAWTRESGPYLVSNSNQWLPMLYGRIVTAEGAISGQETTIRWGGLGQYNPKATYNGDSYLVTWVEKAPMSAINVDWTWWWSVRQLNGLGQPLMSTFRLQILLNFPLIDAPVTVAGQRAGRFVVAWENGRNHSMWESTLMRLNRVFALTNFVKPVGGGFQFDLDGPMSYSYGLESTTNFVNWAPVLRDSLGNMYSPRTITVATTAAPERSFFRAFDGQTACIENLRLLQEAKAHWVLEHNKAIWDSLSDNDLFGAGKYLPVKPVCPNNGTYQFTGGLDPICSWLAYGHTNKY